MRLMNALFNSQLAGLLTLHTVVRTMAVATVQCGAYICSPSASGDWTDR